MTVTAGMYDLRVKEDSQQTVRVEEVFLHPEYSSGKSFVKKYDIGKLSTYSEFKHPYRIILEIIHMIQLYKINSV